MLGSKKLLCLFVFILVVVFPVPGYSELIDELNESESDTPVAVIFSAPITLSDITPDEQAITQMRAQAQRNFSALLSQARMTMLTNKIIEAVSLDYQKKSGIVIDPVLVDKFKQKFSTDANTDSSAQIDLNKVAIKQVRQWQIEKQLYADFGGTVIFQQTNPQMPIGAYKALLKQYHSEGKFTILLPSVESLFWQAFEPPYRFEIAPGNVDYSHPWWL